jgi:mannosylglycerate hydrolase
MLYLLCHKERAATLISSMREAYMPAITAIVLPHSHWDREWYQSFEQLRFELVHFIDDLLLILERDPAIEVFLLDGQVILLEDYLQLRPENRSRLRTLVQAGRLLIGPWYVQPDEFLVSPESLIRNLLAGERYGRQLGPIMKHGYVPDTFGHIAQLPQILQGFGISTFFFMRGLGADVQRLHTEFWWQAPDGSQVLAHHLSETYSNAALLHPDPAQMAIHHGENVHYESYFELRDRLVGRASDDVILLLNGGDHMAVQPHFSETVAALDAALPDHVRNGSLDDFVMALLADQPDLKTLRGELRFGRYHPILKDVLSTRLYLKQANEHAQQLLEGQAERFAAISRAVGGEDYAPFLRYAWQTLLKNHPHDSICGCSIDAVHREMLTRFEQVEQVANKVIDASLHDLAARAVATQEEDQIPIVVFNPSPWERSGRVQVAVAPFSFLPLGERLYDWERDAVPVDLTSCVLRDASGAIIPFRIVGKQLGGEDILNRRKIIERVILEFQADAVPPLGWQVYRLTEEASEPAPVPPIQPSVQPQQHTLENEFLRVVVEANGTLTLTDKGTGRVYPGLHLLADEGDAGDEYTFSPPVAQETFVSTVEDWSVNAPNESTLVVRGSLRLPAALTESRQTRSEEHVACEVISTVRLMPRARRVELSLAFENRARDHRLRAVFPTGFSSVTHSTAETAFGVIERPIEPEASIGWREATSPTYAQRRFVCVEQDGQGLALLNKGLPEYEVSPDGRIWLTLLRSVGWLSRDDLTTRSGPAGPAYATPEAQCLGSHTFDYAIVPYQSGWSQAELFREAEDYWLPLAARSVQGIRPGDLQPLPFAAFLHVEPPQAVLSCLKPAEDNDGIILRLFNPDPTPITARLTLGLPVTSAWHTKLNEEVQTEAVIVTSQAGSEITVPLEPAHAHTLKLRFALA